MNERKCPGCGALMEETWLFCTECGKKIPQKVQQNESLPQVFAGENYGLILTAQGELYGLGENQYGQLGDAATECFREPVLIAREVISAAAGTCYVLYATRDGEIHWQGIGAELMPRVSDICQVWADSTDHYWAVTNSGQLLGMGKEPEKQTRHKTLAAELPQATKLYGSSSDHWTDMPYFDGTPKEYYQQTREYRELSRRFGPRNIVLEIEKVKGPAQKLMGLLVKPVYERVRYQAKLYILTKEYWTPRPVVETWMEDTPHRLGCRPMTKEEYRENRLDKVPGIKKVIPKDLGTKSYLLEDGTAIDGGVLLDWLEQPIRDLARGTKILLLVLQDGQVLWGTCQKYAPCDWKRKLKPCPLPEGRKENL